jgi:hypothetical protein
MQKESLEQLVGEGLSSYAIAEKLGKSQTTVWYWLKKYELCPKKLYKCTICNDMDETHFTKGRFSQCKICRRKEQNRTTKKYKLVLVQYKGGKCELCGYSKCVASLDFHHKDPTQKDPNWIKMRRWNPERVKKEVDKCRLVCKNCHGEIHYEQGVV